MREPIAPSHVCYSSDIGHLNFLDSFRLAGTTMPRLTRYKRFSFVAAQRAQQQSFPLRL
jgi:hypothetical protein